MTARKDTTMSLAQWELCKAMTETALFDQIKARTNQRGMCVVHFFAARVGKRVITPQAGTPGFPDCVVAYHGLVLVRELKRESLRTNEFQEHWLRETGGRVWQPHDLLDGSVDAELDDLAMRGNYLRGMV